MEESNIKKNIILILGLIVLVFLCFKIFFIKNFEDLSTENQALKEKNQRLQNEVEDYKEENRGLILKITNSYEQNKELVLEIERIIQKNIAIEAINKKNLREQQKISKKFNSYKKAYSLRVKNKINNKLISAPAKAVPLLGTTAIVAMTVNDIKSICNEYDILNKFEKDVFESISETNSSAMIEKLCTYDIRKELTPQIEKTYNESIRIFSSQIGKTEIWVQEEVINSIKDTYNEVLDKDYNKSIHNGKDFVNNWLKKISDSD